jgi:hypothetical protein
MVYTPSDSFVSCVNPGRTKQKGSIRIAVKIIPVNLLIISSSLSKNWHISFMDTKVSLKLASYHYFVKENIKQYPYQTSCDLV